MACEAVPACTMGAAAKAYVFPTESVTELTVAVESFQPTTTTFRFPAVCAPAYVTVTEVSVPCGVAVVPLKVTLLLPWVEPKFAPVMVTEVPTGPDVGFRLAMLGAGVPPEAARKATICMIHC